MVRFLTASVKEPASKKFPDFFNDAMLERYMKRRNKNPGTLPAISLRFPFSIQFIINYRVIAIGNVVWWRG
jgi:hypothetical protein